MAAAAKKNKKKGKTLTLTDFLAEDSGGNAPPSYAPPKPTSWADETDDLEGDVTTSWHTEDDVYRAPPIDRSILPTAPRAAREPNIDRSRLPRSPPYTAFLGNLPYDVTEDSIKNFFRGLSISAVRLPREPSNPERLKGFGYAEFDDVDSLLRALSLNEENLGNRRIRVDIADQSNEKERDDRSMSGRDRNRSERDMGPDKTDSDWRARPKSDADDGPRRDDAFGERSRDRFDPDRGQRWDNDRNDGGRDRYRERYDDKERRDYDRGYESRSSGRRPFGSGFRRDYDDRRDDRRDDFRGSGERYGDRFGDREERYERRDEKCEDRGPVQRPRLNLKPRSVPKEEDQSSSPSIVSGRAASIFGGAKPVDTAAKEREVEERLKKEQERLQRQLEEDKNRGPERKPRDRHPSWRSEDQATERSRTGSESSQTGSTSSRAPRRRESERSVENEVFSSRDDELSSHGSQTTAPKQEGLPLKVVPAPPPKENAWAKRSTMTAGSSESDRKPVVPPSSSISPQSVTSSADAPQRTKDENKADGMRRDRGPSRGRGGTSGSGAGRGRGDAASRDRRKETDRKEARRERDLRPAPDPKKFEEPPSPEFSSASKYAALLMDGELGDEERGGD
ncbi:eukaryotic translation initiation factor 4Ba isoform X2 [Pimephales promelas]|uniref:eukaryotic translation initiation factor 4Ba isoform X2 n=1 Tax=Pimephales promelas TaxID=90988 RepID=UPI001955DF47|nr:eukaryotic translation initiation factor 4Ba isoform X2 [Pimephales promelas]KAG1962093.1 eukaryotic translation initiation factor 4B [Pimephales promelas]